MSAALLRIGAGMLACVSLACVSLAGCVALPVPVPQRGGAHADSRAVPEAAPTGVIPGVTTRREVLLLLGEPDERATWDSRFVYQAVARRGGVRWGMLVLIPGDGDYIPLGNWSWSRRLTIDFDEYGIVTDVAADDRDCARPDQSFTARDTCARHPDAAQEQRDAALRWSGHEHAAGAVLARHDGYMLRQPGVTACAPRDRDTVLAGNQLLVAEQFVLWRDTRASAETWGSLPVREIEEVTMLRGWVTIRRQDGTCVALRLTNGDQQQLRDHILKAVATHRGAHSETLPAASD